MIPIPNQARRFDNLYLESSEMVTQELVISAIYRDPNTSKPQKEQGILIVGSKSLIFEPSNAKRNILKFLFSSFEEDLITDSHSHENVICRASRVVEIKTEGPPSPYIITSPKDSLSKTFIFILENKQAAAGLLKWVGKLTAFWKQEHLVDDPVFHVTQLVIFQLSRTDLDRRALEYPDETLRISEQILVQRIFPLTSVYCFFFLTERNMYLWRVAVGGGSMRRVSLGAVGRVRRRRFELRDIALEIEAKGESFYLNFREPGPRERVFSELARLLPARSVAEPNLSELTDQWVTRRISNFDYLMGLNSLAQRSFSDLTQYPVFPWVVVDFDSEELDLEDPRIYRDLSRPIKALNPRRVEAFRRRQREGPGEDGQVFGTHYSTPGYVVGYKFRAFPLWMMHLQGGKFDLPDRLFQDFRQEWENCYSFDGCVKELIPEFFMNDESILVNRFDLDLGFNYARQKVENVVLPLWARSPAHFLQLHREALESEHVSQNLHKWIDLIFGYKQRGQAALEADNLFLSSSYEGAINLELIQESLERRALREQIREFGQTPRQLFFESHPRRKNKLLIHPLPDPESDPESDLPCPIDFSQPQKLSLKNLSFSFSSVMAPESLVSCVCFALSPCTEEIYAFQNDRLIRIFSSQSLQEIQTFKLFRSKVVFAVFLTKNIIALALSDYYIVLFNINFGAAVQTIHAHTLDITCLHYSSKRKLLFSSSLDCSVKMWRFKAEKLSSPEVIEEGEDYETTALALIEDSSNESRLVLCNSQGTIKLYSLSRFSYQLS